MTLRRTASWLAHWAGNLLDDSVASAPRATGPSWAELYTERLAVVREGRRLEREAVVARLREFETGCRANCQYTTYSAEVWDLVADGVAELAEEIRDGEHVREVSDGR